MDKKASNKLATSLPQRMAMRLIMSLPLSRSCVCAATVTPLQRHNQLRPLLTSIKLATK